MAESDSLDNNSEGSTDDEVALMSKNFKQMIKKKGKFQRSSRWKDRRFKKKHKEENNEIICFECKRPRHMKAEGVSLAEKKKDALWKKERKVWWSPGMT